MLLFLIKASLIIAILWAFYKLFLERESFFVANRIYLLTCLVLALALPFVHLPKMIHYQGTLSNLLNTVEEEKAPFEEGNYMEDAVPSVSRTEKKTTDETDMAVDETIYIDQNQETTSNNQMFETQKSQSAPEQESPDATTTAIETPTQSQERPLAYWLMVVYLFGVGVLLVNLLAQIAGTLFKAIRNDDKVVDEDGILVNMEGEVEPCSFFNYIFINPEQYDFETYEQIIAHEKIHVRFWHSVDLLLSEIAVALFWFNPFVWQVRKEVEKNIEYQTDHEMTTRTETEKKGYQMNLLKIATFNKPLTITTNYNQSLIKQRILKMNAKKSNPYSYWKYAFAAPIVFVMLLTMNEPLEGSAEALIATDDYTELLNITVDSVEVQAQIIEQLINDGIVENANDDIYFFLLGESINTNGRIIKDKEYKRYTDLLESKGLEIKPYWGFYSSQNGGDFQGVSNQLIVDYLIEFYERQQVTNKQEGEDGTADVDGMKKLKILHKIFEELRQQLKSDKIVDGEDIVFEYTQGSIIVNGKKLSEQQTQSYLQFFQDRGITILEEQFKLHILPGKEHWQVDGKIEFNQTDVAESQPVDTDFKEFMLAIENDDVESVKTYLEKGVDIYQADENGFTPLLLAAYRKNKDITRLLTDRTLQDVGFNLEEDAGYRITDADHDVDFHINVDHEYGRNDYFSETEIDWDNMLLDSIDYSDFTLFMSAIQDGNNNIVESFIENGIDVNGIGRHQFTPLMMAANGNHPEIAQLLIEKGANVNYINSSGWTALIETADEGAYATAVVLLEAGANVNLHDEFKGKSAVTMAASEGHSNFLQLLLNAGADLALLNNGYPPLQAAAEEGQQVIVEILLQQGIDVNSKDHHERTALSYAAIEGKYEVAAYLIEKGAEIDSKDENERTPLMYAVIEGEEDVTQLLLEQGADPSLKDDDGYSVMDHAIESGNPQVMALILEKQQGGNSEMEQQYGINALIEAVDDGSQRIVEELIANGVNVNGKSRSGWTPLMEAADEANLPMVKLLLENGADVNAKSSIGWTALMEAIDEEDVAMVQYLIQKGADVNATTRGKWQDDNSKFQRFTVLKGWTPLFEAIDQRNTDIAKILIANGANVNAEQVRIFDEFDYRTPLRQINNWTPLLDAVQQEQLSMVELLIRKGADVTLLTNTGKSVLDIAKQTGDKTLINFVDNATESAQLPAKISLKVESPIGDELKVTLNLKEEAALLIELFDSNNLPVKRLIKGNFKGEVRANWKPKTKSGTYLLKIMVDGQGYDRKIGDGTDYPWE